MFSDPAPLTGPVTASIGLSLALLSSPYNFMFCIAAAAVLVPAMLFEPWARANAVAFPLRRGGIAVLIVALLAGWLIVGMARAYESEPYAGNHIAALYSADVESFLTPNHVNIASVFLSRWRQWGTGGEWIQGNYIGLILLGLAVCGLVSARAARQYGYLACLGAVLALGPHLHVGGRAYDSVLLPYGWLDRFLPGIRFSGIPARFGELTLLGVVAAAGSTLAHLCRRGLTSAAIILTIVAVAETWPRPMPMTAWPRIDVLERLAADSRPWAVLDATPPGQALWNQMSHRHPTLAGYATRIPERLWTQWNRDRTIRGFFGPPYGPRGAVLAESAATLDRLHELHVHVVIVEELNAKAAADAGLLLTYAGQGVCVFEVP